MFSPDAQNLSVGLVLESQAATRWKKILIALTHKILTFINSMLTTGYEFDDELYQRKRMEQEQRRQNQMIRAATAARI